MKAAITNAAIKSQLATKFGEDVFKLSDHGYDEVISVGISEIDALAGGLPRGAITEIFGPQSSGRTSLILSALAHATNHDEVCALVDTSDVLDAHSAVNAFIDLDRLLWIRCASNLEHSFKAVDLLLQGGGFGLVVLDLGDVHASEARRIISSWWYRFRRVVENTPTALVVVAQDACARSCASLTLALERKETVWSTVNSSHKLQSVSPDFTQTNVRVTQSTSPYSARQVKAVTHTNLLRSSSIKVDRIKPVSVGPCKVQFIA